MGKFAFENRLYVKLVRPLLEEIRGKNSMVGPHVNQAAPTRFNVESG